MRNTKLFIIPLLLVLALSTVNAFYITGTVTHDTWADVLTNQTVTCYNTTHTNGSVTTGALGTYAIGFLTNASGTVVDVGAGTYTCNSTGIIGSTRYYNSSLAVTVSDNTTNQNMTSNDEYWNTYESDDTDDILFDLGGTVGVVLVGFGSIIGLMALWLWSKGRKPYGKI